MMNYPFNLDEWGETFDHVKTRIVEALNEHGADIFLLDAWGYAIDYLRDELLKELREKEAKIKTGERLTALMARLYDLKEAEVEALREANARLDALVKDRERAIEELLHRPDLEEDEPEVPWGTPEDPRTLAEIAREHGWL